MLSLRLQKKHTIFSSWNSDHPHFTLTADIAAGNTESAAPAPGSQITGKSALRWQGTAAYALRTPTRKGRWCPASEVKLPLLAKFNLLYPAASFLELSNSPRVSARLFFFSHLIPPSFSARRLRADSSSDCVPDSFVFIQSGSFRVFTNFVYFLWVSDCLSVDSCLKYSGSFRAPSMSGTPSISSARPAVESSVLSRSPE